ncbi:MAG: hypothetical protein ABJN26_28315 [Stappiaceae bacterium]
MLQHPKDDMANRLPVWEACSEFYLDIELDASDYVRIATICANSPYSSNELDTIMFDEVWPAFSPNLMAVAGEWSGWTKDAIKESILASFKSRRRLPWKLNPIKRFYCSDWTVVKEAVANLRASQA